MPSQFSVGLDVRNFGSSGSDGYKNTTATNGATYSYKYSGGSDNEGNVTSALGNGNAAITIQLNSDPRYRINNVAFTDDSQSQLSWRSNAPTTAVITDANNAAEDADYTLTVGDTTANCTFPCDPYIVNRPAK
jgi:hypothetical protein